MALWVLMAVSLASGLTKAGYQACPDHVRAGLSRLPDLGIASGHPP
jgi:hypothetical protein